MKKTVPLALTIFVSTYISPVLAEDNNWYVGGSYTAQKISFSPAGRDFKTLGFTAGYQYNQYFSLETRFSKGTSGNTYDYTVVGFEDEEAGEKTDIDYQALILIKASYPLSEKFNVYATTGYAQTQIERKVLDPMLNSMTGVNQSTFTSTEKGLTYGLGADYKVTNNVSLFVEYQTLPDWKPVSSVSHNWDSINLGFNYAF